MQKIGRRRTQPALGGVGGAAEAWNKQQGQDLTTLSAHHFRVQCRPTGMMVILPWIWRRCRVSSLGNVGTLPYTSHSFSSSHQFLPGLRVPLLRWEITET